MLNENATLKWPQLLPIIDNKPILTTHDDHTDNPYFPSKASSKIIYPP